MAELTGSARLYRSASSTRKEERLSSGLNPLHIEYSEMVSPVQGILDAATPK